MCRMPFEINRSSTPRWQWRFYSCPCINGPEKRQGFRRGRGRGLIIGRARVRNKVQRDLLAVNLHLGRVLKKPEARRALDTRYAAEAAGG